MKKNVIVATLCCCLAITISAQRYVNAVSGISAGAIDEVIQTQWNTNSNNPVTLVAKPSGFALINFSETNGAMTTGNGITLDNGTLNFYKPVAMAQVGTNEMVVGQDRDYIYYTLVNTTTGFVTYSYAMPKTYSGPFYAWQSAVAIDIAYDGTQYCNLLTRSLLSGPGGTCNVFGYLKINVLTGSVFVYPIEGLFTPGLDYYPNDIEYVDATHMYVSGTRVNNGVTSFFIANLNQNNRGILNYSTSTLTPAHCYVKASGTTLWLTCDMNNSMSSTSPLVLMKLTDNGLSYTVNSASTYSFSMRNIVSVDRRSNYLLVGATNATNSQAQQWLFNTSTASLVNCASYSTTGTNVRPFGIYSPVSQRIFTTLCDNATNIFYNLRTDANSTATNCHSLIPIAPKSLLVPVTGASMGWKAGDVVLVQNIYSTVAYSLTIGTQCAVLAADPAENGNVNIARNSSSVAAPNPANDQLTILAAEEKEIRTIEIYSMTGQRLQALVAENGLMVNLSTAALENGIYLFIIRNTDETIENKTIVVQH